MENCAFKKMCVYGELCAYITCVYKTFCRSECKLSIYKKLTTGTVRDSKQLIAFHHGAILMEAWTRVLPTSIAQIISKPENALTSGQFPVVDLHFALKILVYINLDK